MKNFEEMQKKAKNLMEEALTLLKSGMVEAEFLAEKTASATKLHVQAKKCQLEKYKSLYKLGELVLNDADKPNFKLTKPMKDIVSKVNDLNVALKEAEGALKKFTVVNKVAKAKKKLKK